MDIPQVLTVIGSALSSGNSLAEFFGKLSAWSGARKADIEAAQKQASDMKEALYAAKDKIFELKDRNAELVDRIEELEDRLRRREEYALKLIGPGAFAYVAKATDDAVENGPWLCQTCFDAGKQSVLQFRGSDPGSDRFQCALCKSELRVPNDLPTMIVEAF